jgi:hypothetical protein
MFGGIKIEKNIWKILYFMLDNTYYAIHNIQCKIKTIFVFKKGNDYEI